MGGYLFIEDGSDETIITELCWLDVLDCRSLTRLPADLLNLKFLTRLSFSGCFKLKELREIKETMENLTVLVLDGTAITELLPSSLHHLVGLEKLSLQCCKKLKTIPSSIGNLSKLHTLDLAYCESLETFPSSIFKSKFTKLSLQGCSMLSAFPEIPNNIGCFSPLTKLSLQESGIVNLPECMAHLSSLKSLDLSDCKMLECILKLPPNLNKLLAFDCPSIKRIVLNSKSKLLSDSKGTFQFYLTNCQELNASFFSNIGDEARNRITDDAYNSVFFIFPGSQFPRWFPYHCQGHSVTLEKNSSFNGKNKLIGFAMCFVLRSKDMDDTNARFSSLRCRLSVESDGQPYDMHFLTKFRRPKYANRFINQDVTFLWNYRFNRIDNRLFHANSFTLKILDEDLHPFTVKKCGMCLLYGEENDDNGLFFPLKKPKYDDNGIEEPSTSKAAQ